MPNEWEERFASRREIPYKLKEKLDIRIFGPYSGDCSYILSDVAEKLREDEHYNARICLDSPSIKSISEQESGEVFNLEASIECIQQADVCVFVFMSSDLWKFAGFGPSSGSYSCQEDIPLIPSDLNSSVAVEFDRWDQGLKNPNTGLVLYENETEENIGSLIRGIAMSSPVYSEPVETCSYPTAVQNITDTIAGHARFWEDQFEDILYDRINNLDNGD